MTRQCRSLILVMLAALIVGAIFAVPKLLDVWWYRDIPELVPRSDVPVTRNLVYAPRTPEVEVLEMSVKGTTVAREKDHKGCRFILQAKLRCRVPGTVSEDSPLIQCAQITARQIKSGDFGITSEADVEIRLIAGTRETAGDANAPSEISITVEDVVDAISMGRHVYHVRCGGHTDTVELDFDPKGRAEILTK